MNVDNMKEYVKNAYPGASWHTKVNMMSDRQIIAIYHSIRERDKKNLDYKKLSKRIKKNDEGYQFTIFDILDKEKYYE